MWNYRVHSPLNKHFLDFNYNLKKANFLQIWLLVTFNNIIIFWKPNDYIIYLIFDDLLIYLFLKRFYSRSRDNEAIYFHYFYTSRMCRFTREKKFVNLKKFQQYCSLFILDLRWAWFLCVYIWYGYANLSGQVRHVNALPFEMITKATFR